jgi:3-deoxy-D-manno-octulosonate 8-phosphate phosphatase (KDO 8-P phosphatase)
MSSRASQGTDGARLEECIRKIRLVAFDFDGVLTDNMVYVHEDGTESVLCYRGDGIGLGKLKQLGIATAIISSELTPVVSARSRKLGIRCVQSAGDKFDALRTFAEEQLGLSMEQVAFVGNDLNDLTCLKAVGLPMVVQDAHPDVAPYAKYRTRSQGGHGAVREICDMFERVLLNRDAGENSLDGERPIHLKR